MRIRSIKPEFWKSEAIARHPHRTRLTFIALWSYVDDNGVGRDIPQIIAGELFALEDDPREALASVREDLARLREAGRITRYTVEGKPYLHVTGFDEHQRIDKPGKPRYPLPTDPAATLTCENTDSRESLARVSRESREGSAPGAVEQWSREQGAGEESSCPAEPDESDRLPLALVCESLPVEQPKTSPEPPGFTEWWATYPRREAKGAGRKAYVAARKRASAAQLLAGAARLRDDPTRDPQFTPLPASWLNADRWEDEGPARPQSVQANSADERHARNLALVEHFRQQEQASEQRSVTA